MILEDMNLESQVLNGIPEEDEVWVRDEHGKLVKLEVADDDADD